MEFIADLHLHSHFSRATAKNLDLENTCKAAMLKGITVAGTGDFTHPGWFKELEDKLEPAEDGLFRLKADIDSKIRFILQCEISSIYKKDGRVRKNHNLIYFPDMSSVRVFNEKLGKIGNITSDGRPILGLDCEKLLEIVLETSEDGFMIPAHIWTPWFSMFGSKSGFDSVEECFGSLAHHIFAVETGLSSDLPMNWRIENLDRMSFISSSDAHSPMFMGRNASSFNTALSYFGIRDALKQISPPGSYVGTIDMHPEEGKYHYDGHRKCNICFNPSETEHHGGICPECGKPLTLGVLYRVQQLASRPEGYIPENRHGYQTIIPLAEILAEICGTGPKTKKVELYYKKALESLGPELDILLKKEIAEIDRAGIPLLSEAIRRMRNNQILMSPGFDGEFGRVTVFAPDEKERLKGDLSIFPLPVTVEQNKKCTEKKEEEPNGKIKEILSFEKSIPCKKRSTEQEFKLDRKTAGTLNKEQQQAIASQNRPLLMEAGPGTGKTRTLTEKIVALITNYHVKPESILALTFTTKAAEEMRQRIAKLLPDSSTGSSIDNDLEVFGNSTKNQDQVITATFHGFCLMVLKEYTDYQFAIVDDTLRKILVEQAIKLVYPEDFRQIASSKMELAISMLKQGVVLNTGISNDSHVLADSTAQDSDLVKDPCKDYYLNPSDAGSLSSKTSDSSKQYITARVLSKYQELLLCYQLVDFEDLMLMTLDLIQRDSELLSKLKRRFAYVFVDEYQDINSGQYQLIKLIAGDGKHLCVIGDPDQSIYGFRGADNQYFKNFEQDYPDTEKIIFKRNYRSTETILEASFQMITKREDNRNSLINSDLDHTDYQNISKTAGLFATKTAETLKPMQTQVQKEKLFSGIQGERQIHILEAASEEAQAVMIGKTIERIVGGISMFSMDAGKADSALEHEYSFSDIAVLYRTKKQSELLSKVLEKAGIPFQTADSENLFLQKGIKELISSIRILLDRGTLYDLEVIFDHLKCATGAVTREKLKTWFYNNPDPDRPISILHRLQILSESENSKIKAIKSLADTNMMPVPNIGKNIKIKIVECAEKLLGLYNQSRGKSTSEILKLAIIELDIEKVFSKSQKSLETANKIIKEAEKYPDPARFYEYIVMKKDIDTIEYQAEKVSLMTMHSAKGLEFKVVFIAGCEKGLIPFCNYDGECENIDEERRLFYVAMTRAEELLYLCHTKKRQIYGKTVMMERSPFLHDIEESLKYYSKTTPKQNKKSDHTEQLDLFSKI